MTTLPIRNPIGRSPLRHRFLLIALALACFALLQTAHAVNYDIDTVIKNDVVYPAS
jgi:hypothetical protein